MRKKTSKKKRIFIIIAVLIAGILIGTAAFGFLYFKQDGTNGTTPGTDGTVNLDKRVSFLLIGADKRPGDSSFNSDTIIVASVDPDTKIISLLSIPRDTRVTYGSSYVKMNALPMLKGIPELMSQVTDLTGIQLDGYVLTNFNGFKSIIDTLGGIDIDVEKDMYYETGDAVDGVINLKAGEHRLTGTQALQYARFRHDATADIGRTARQQKVLKAVAKQMLQTTTLTKLPKLVPQLMAAVETNLNLVELVKLSKVAVSFDSSNIVSQTLPGYGLYLDYISYWEVNRDKAKEVAENLLLGITTDNIIDNTVIDLLDPEIKAHITVPGNSNDPNGTKSPGHNDSGTQATPSDQSSQPAINDGSNIDAEKDTNINTDTDTNTNSSTNTSATGINGQDQVTSDNNFSTIITIK